MKAVFIGGCGRSGTTMLGDILGRLKGCITTPESHFKINAYHLSLEKLGEVNVPKAAAIVAKNFQSRLWGIKKGQIDFSSYNNSIQGYSDYLKNLVNIYAKNNGVEGNSVWIDHTPSNVSYAMTLAKIFPDAKFVHIIRDGRAVASSVMPLDWGPNTISSAARWWMQSTGLGLAAEQSSVGSRIIRVKYEQIVSEPDQTLDLLCNFLELEKKKCNNTPGFVVPEYTKKQHILVGKDVDSSRVNNWKNKLTSRQIELFEIESADFLNYLGYYPVATWPLRPPTFREKMNYCCAEITAKAICRVKNKLRHFRHSVMADC